MKAICLSNLGMYGDEESYYKRQDENMPDLEVGKVYDVREYNIHNTNMIGYVIDAANKFWYFNCLSFKDLRLLREEKLKELGI